MKSISNYILITIDDVDAKTRTKGGIVLHLSYKGNMHTNFGYLHIDSEVDGIVLKKGTKVYFHPKNLVNQLNEYYIDGLKVYRVPKDSVYGYVYGAFKPLNDYVLCRYIELQSKSKSGIYLESTAKKIQNQAIIDVLPPCLLFSYPTHEKVNKEYSIDLVVGDLVYIDVYSNLEMEIEGEKYYLVQLYCILATCQTAVSVCSS